MLIGTAIIFLFLKFQITAIVLSITYLMSIIISWFFYIKFLNEKKKKIGYYAK